MPDVQITRNKKYTAQIKERTQTEAAGDKQHNLPLYDDTKHSYHSIPYSYTKRKWSKWANRNILPQNTLQSINSF